MLGGLILARAKWEALARQERVAACEISTDDLANAVSTVQHAYGRSALLGFKFMNTLQRQICTPDAFERVIHETVFGTPSKTD